jgi:hypothetical protein
LRINGDDLGQLYVKRPELTAGGVDYFEGENKRPENVEDAQWINAIRTSTYPVVLPEQVLVVTQIIDAIYASAKVYG